MDIMRFCYKFMFLIGVCAPINHNKWKILGGVARSTIVLTAMTVCVFQPCIRYFLRHLSNLVEATGVGLMVSIGFFATVSLISFSLQQTQVHDTLLRFQSSVKKYASNSQSRIIFANAERQSDWYTKRITSSLLGFVCTMILTASITISTVLSAKGIGPEGWMVPYKAIFTIEQSTFGRYCIILALEMVGGFSILTCVTSIASFFVSMCIYLIAFVRSYEILLASINQMALQTYVNRIDFTGKFTQLIELHVEIYVMAEKLIKLVRAVILSTLYGSVIFFATSIFQCEMLGYEKLNAEFFVSISGLWMSVVGMYVYSYFATKTTSEIQAIGEKMYETQWHRYPSEFRMFVQLTISRSHRPLHFHGFGLINCDMVTFSKLVNSAVSYYLMFRRMG
ncbi:uncharacterized protein LOC129578467 [Sitodiplosis mosellana]|uniref:uncharacterized protein LOC129578467 n=1 Tax=Sitodiplosis mosellana TaxID=263140 RepID=UPI0024446436|nr:uncharacterized protein LOC129578467 [Sitodiplosis mosellana]